MYIRLYGSYKQNFNGYTYVFGVQQSSAAIPNAIRANRKWEIQDGGRQTGNTCNSACTQHRNKIPTAIPMFSGYSNPVQLSRMLSELTGSGKFKMAATKPEIPVTQLVHNIETKFLR